jgi:hypothetical protein
MVGPAWNSVLESVGWASLVDLLSVDAKRPFPASICIVMLAESVLACFVAVLGGQLVERMRRVRAARAPETPHERSGTT